MSGDHGARRKRPALVLASASPRRAELLAQLGVAFAIEPQNIDETPAVGELPRDYVVRMALEKALACAHRPVLAADTIVVAEGHILGKPRDRAAARVMLGRLAGGWHEVFTAVALRADELRQLVVCTRVEFKPLDEAEIDAYWATGEPADKAGAYGIQGLGGAFVSRIDGSYSNVVGLPLVETVSLLEGAGVSTWLKKKPR